MRGTTQKALQVTGIGSFAGIAISFYQISVITAPNPNCERYKDTYLEKNANARKRPPTIKEPPQRVNHDKVSTTDQSFSSNNDVISTKPSLEYSSQNLASRGYKKCLVTLKFVHPVIK